MSRRVVVVAIAIAVVLLIVLPLVMYAWLNAPSGSFSVT